jgi:hypothetical protein
VKVSAITGRPDSERPSAVSSVWPPGTSVALWCSSIEDDRGTR